MLDAKQHGEVELTAAVPRHLASARGAFLLAIAMTLGAVPFCAARAGATTTHSGSESIVALHAMQAWSARGSRQLHVSAPRPWSVAVSDVRLASHGWAAFLVLGSDRSNRGMRLGVLSAPRPVGCSAPSAEQLCPANGVITTIEDSQGRTKASRPGLPDRLTYPAGRYTVLLLTDAKSTVLVRWHAGELTGSEHRTLTAGVEADAFLAADYGARSAHASGTFPVNLARPGALLLTAWTATVPQRVNALGSVQLCLDRGRPQQTLPELISDYGCGYGADPQTVGTAGGQGTVNGLQSGGLFNFVMPAGQYFCRYANDVTGAEPGTGVFAVWYRAAD